MHRIVRLEIHDTPAPSVPTRDTVRMTMMYDLHCGDGGAHKASEMHERVNDERRSADGLLTVVGAAPTRGRAWATPAVRARSCGAE